MIQFRLKTKNTRQQIDKIDQIAIFSLKTVCQNSIKSYKTINQNKKLMKFRYLIKYFNECEIRVGNYLDTFLFLLFP